VTESGGIVTILFTDVVNSTETLSRLGDVRAEELRRSHFNDLRDVIAESGGHEVKTMGDGFMVVFASAVDALHCAVGMQQVVAVHEVGLRVGLHVGEPMREGEDYFGTPVVVASRLCDAAAAGQILTSDLVHALVGSRGEFTFHDAGFMALKGIEEPVAAWEVGWDRPTSELFPLPPQLDAGERLPFVGRGDLLDELRIQWKKARDGHRALVMLAGEPGIGKTRLAAEFARECHEDGAIALFGHADEETLLPYQPFVEALHHIVRTASLDTLQSLVGNNAAELGRLLPSLRDRVGELPEPMRSDADSERFRLFEAATELLASLSAEAPIVLVLDDLHWADRPTLLLLHHLFRATTGMGLLLIGTYRDTDLDRRHPLAETLADLRRLVQFERLAVGGLAEDDLNRFIDLVTGREPPPGFARAVQDQTEGNPFFIGEVLRHLIESGAVSVVDGEWVPTVGLDQLGIPEGVTEVIGRRLSRLSDDANAALAVAAVTGRDFDLDVIERVTEMDEDRLLSALDEAVTARLVVELPGAVTRFHFSHALVRETLYDELTTARRVRMHRRVAQALEELHERDLDAVLAPLAYHWFESASAGDVNRAVDYCRRAGDLALGQLAYEEAAGHYERALQALDLADVDDPRTRGDLLAALGDAQLRAGNPADSRASYRAALELARALDDADRFAVAALGVAGPWEVGVSDHDVVVMLDEASRRFGDRETADHARVLTRIAIESYFGERERMGPLAQRALDMARRVGDKPAVGYALNAAFALADGIQNLDARLELTAEALQIGIETNDADVEHWGRTFRGFALLELGDVAEFERQIAAAEELIAKVRLPAIAWYVPMWRAMLATAQGRIADAEPLAIEALSIAQLQDDLTPMQMFGVQLFAIRAEQGRLDEVEASVRSMVEEFPAIPAWRLGLALVLAEIGQHDQSRAELATVCERGVSAIPLDANWSTCMALLAFTSFFVGVADYAAEAYELLLPYEHRFVAIGQCADWYGSISRPLGEFAAVRGDFDRAIGHLERAIEADRSRGATRMEVRGAWELATVLLRRDGPGDRDRARGIVDDMTPTAESLGLVVVAERLRNLIQPTG
jgi:tetratricopeptide (TPR) repeat protein